jgi:Zn-dependent protease
MLRTFPLATIRGITIRAHPSAIVAFVTLLLVLVAVYYPGTLPNERGQTYWSVGFLTTLCLFMSVTAHELGHAIVASARGVPVSAVNLMMFSATSDIKREEEKPVDELLINIAGPAVSLLLATAAIVARLVLPGQSLPLMGFLELVLILNLWLGVFNLLPTLPLDGGLAVRGLLWHQTGDYRRATRIASLFGRGLAGLLFASGVALLIVSLDGGPIAIPAVFTYDPRVIALIIILVAWFLNTGARNAYRHVVLEQRFQGVPISRIMTPDPPTIAPSMSLEDVVNEYFLQRGERSVAVARDGDVLMGLVAYSDTRKVPRAEWGSHAAGEVMTPASQLVKVSPDDSIDVAVKHMAERHFNQLPVVRDGRLVGMIARVNVLRFLDLKDESAA